MADDQTTQVAALEARIVELRQELWQARDAVIGATATAGSYRARNVELEMLVHQLRAEIARLDRALGARSAGAFASKVRRAATDPAAVLRRLMR